MAPYPKHSATNRASSGWEPIEGLHKAPKRLQAAFYRPSPERQREWADGSRARNASSEIVCGGTYGCYFGIFVRASVGKWGVNCFAGGQDIPTITAVSSRQYPAFGGCLSNKNRKDTVARGALLFEDERALSFVRGTMAGRRTAISPPDGGETSVPLLGGRGSHHDGRASHCHDQRMHPQLAVGVGVVMSLTYVVDYKPKIVGVSPGSSLGVSRTLSLPSRRRL